MNQVFSHSIEMSALQKFYQQVSSCINTAFDEIIKHQLAAMFYLEEGDLGFLNFIQLEVEHGNYSDIQDFESHLNYLMTNQIDKLRRFQASKSRVINHTKRRVLEKVIKSILEDLERLSNDERVKFDQKYGEFFGHLVEEPEKVNFKLVDIDRAVKLQKDLFLYLRERDAKWFNHYIEEEDDEKC